MEAMVWPRSNQLRERERKKKSQACNSIPLFTSRQWEFINWKKGSFPPRPLLHLAASLLPRNWFLPAWQYRLKWSFHYSVLMRVVDCECATVCREDAAARSAAVATVWWIREGRETFAWPPWSMMERDEPASSWGSLSSIRFDSALLSSHVSQVQSNETSLASKTEVLSSEININLHYIHIMSHTHMHIYVCV